MLRRFLRTSIISLSKADWAQRLVTQWGLARKVSSRFVSGETLDQALIVIKKLNEWGLIATLDHLGENTTNPEEACMATAEVIIALEKIAAAGVRSNFSIKLSQMGLVLDEGLCRENLAKILTQAQKFQNFIRIDMEDSGFTSQTLGMLRWAWDQGFTNVGIVLQSYLYRTENDVKTVLERNGHIRLCKGAYDEPPDVAFPHKKDVDNNYDRLAIQLIEGALKAGSPRLSNDGCVPPIPAFATHDPTRIKFVLSEVNRVGLPKNALEFQMLYGIRRDLQEALAQQCYPVRVYVPYGTRWYPYFMRRLAERPSNIWFFVSNFFKK